MTWKDWWAQVRAKIGRGLLFAIFCGLAVLFCNRNATARDTFRIGEGGRSWKPAETFSSLEVVEGAIAPVEIDSMDNVAKKAASMWSPQNYWVDDMTGRFTDGNDKTYWLVGDNKRGASLLIDLGATYPISRVSFSPGVIVGEKTEKETFIRGYEIYINDGSPEKRMEGNPIYELLAANSRNLRIIVDERFPPRFIRYLKILSATDLRFSIGEIDIRGTGVSPFASYVSQVIDLGSPANFGYVRLSAEIPAQTALILRTRTGLVPDPVLYYRKMKTQAGADSLVEVSKQEYDALSSALKGPVSENTRDWDPWSAPYSSLEQMMASPGNRRYVQFRFDFSSADVRSRAIAHSLSFEYSTPPVAHAVLGEIWPADVVLGEDTTFDYYLRATEISGGETGFDALEVETPFKARVNSLKIGDVDVEPDSLREEPERLTVYFPSHKVTDTRLIRLSFSCPVAVYGTTFRGKVFDSSAGELPQDVVPGDVTTEVDTDGLMVRGTLGDELSTGLEISPNPFSPNGDGVNDVAQISYTLLKLNKPTPVELSIYDLGGSVIRRLYYSHDLNGPGLVPPWDGRDDNGRLVPPGVYVCVLSVEAKTGSYRNSRLIGIAY